MDRNDSSSTDFDKYTQETDKILQEQIQTKKTELDSLIKELEKEVETSNNIEAKSNLKLLKSYHKTLNNVDLVGDDNLFRAVKITNSIEMQVINIKSALQAIKSTIFDKIFSAIKAFSSYLWQLLLNSKNFKNWSIAGNINANIPFFSGGISLSLTFDT